MTPAQVVPLVLFTVQFFLWHVGLYTAPVALSLAHILCSSPICNAHSKHYNIFLFKISFFIGFTLKPAILSDTDTVMTTLHFCLFCLFCSHEHLSLLLSSHGCFHVPCFFLETFPGSCLGGPLFLFFHTTCLTLTMSDRCGGSDLTGQALPLGWGGTCSSYKRLGPSVLWPACPSKSFGTFLTHFWCLQRIRSTFWSFERSFRSTYTVSGLMRSGKSSRFLRMSRFRSSKFHF